MQTLMDQTKQFERAYKTIKMNGHSVRDKFLVESILCKKYKNDLGSASQYSRSYNPFKQKYNNYQNRSVQSITFDEYDLFNEAFEEDRELNRNKMLIEDDAINQEQMDDFFGETFSILDIKKNKRKLKLAKKKEYFEKRFENNFNSQKIGFNRPENNLKKIEMSSNYGFNKQPNQTRKNTKLFSNFTENKNKFKNDIKELNVNQYSYDHSRVNKSKKKYLFKFNEDSFMSQFSQSQSQKAFPNKSVSQDKVKQQSQRKFLFSGNKHHRYANK
jgi:hypothetical protein